MLRTLPVLLGVLLLAASPVSAEPSRPISKRQLREQPQAQSNRQVMGQIADLIVTDAPKPSTTPTRLLVQDSFRTRPTGSNIKGMCQVDILTVEFEPVRPKTAWNADTPTRASGFTARRYYAFVTPPSGPRLWEYADSPRDTDCSGTDFWKSGYFQAESETEAATGYRTLLAFREALAAGTITPTCDPLPNQQNMDCKTEVAGLALTALDDLETCGTDYKLGQSCYRFDFWDRTLTIVSQSKSGSLSIISATLSYSVVLSHPLVD